MSAAKSAGENPFWLHAWHDQLAGLQVYSNGITLADVNGDGDYKLLVADSARRLKVFGGTSLLTESPLLTVPSAVCAFYGDHADRVLSPFVAVATGSYVFMFKNMKPHFRFPIPGVQISEEEKKLWDDMYEGSTTVSSAVDSLESLRARGVALSTRSVDLLASDNPKERSRLVARNKELPLQQQNVVTCMGVLLYDADEYSKRSCLVIGTESGMVYVLSCDVSSIETSVQLPSTPAMLLTVGSISLQSRIIAMCRDGTIYSIKDGSLYPSVIQPDSAPVSIARFGNFIAVGTTKRTLQYFNLKGKKQFGVVLPAAITNMCGAEGSGSTDARAVVVALNNGEIRTYNGKTLLHTLRVYGVVTALLFGRYGREDTALIVVLQNGTLRVEFLHRTASFLVNGARESGPPEEQDVPLEIPRVTSVFVEQAEREKLHGAEMYRVFLRDLSRLRLQTARAYSKLLTNGAPATSTSFQTVQTLTLGTAIQGLGPAYKIKVTVQNTSPTALRDLALVTVGNPEAVIVKQSYISIAFLKPSTVYLFDVIVLRKEGGVSPIGGSTVRVLVSTPASSVPLASEIVPLPDEDVFSF